MKSLQNQCSLRIDSDMHGHRGISVFRGCVSYLWRATVVVLAVTTMARKSALALKRRSPPTDSKAGGEAHPRASSKGQHVQQRRLSAWSLPMSRLSGIAKGRQVMYRLLPPTLQLSARSARRTPRICNLLLYSFLFKPLVLYWCWWSLAAVASKASADPADKCQICKANLKDL